MSDRIPDSVVIGMTKVLRGAQNFRDCPDVVRDEWLASTRAALGAAEALGWKLSPVSSER